MLSPTYLSAIVLIAVSVLKAIGVEVGSPELTTTIQTVVTIVAGIIIAVRRYTSKKQPAINAFGAVKA